VTLQKGMQEQTLSLANPMTKTGLVTTASMPLSSVSPVPAVTPQVNAARQTYADRQRDRVEEARRRAQETRDQQDEARRRELEQQVAERAEAAVRDNMRAMNLNLIRNGQPPMADIELTPEEVRQLVSEGVLDASALTQ